MRRRPDPPRCARSWAWPIRASTRSRMTPRRNAESWAATGRCPGSQASCAQPSWRGLSCGTQSPAEAMAISATGHCPPRPAPCPLWHAAGPVLVPPAARAPRGDERLPIYDAVESDWFRRGGANHRQVRPRQQGLVLTVRTAAGRPPRWFTHRLRPAPRRSACRSGHRGQTWFPGVPPIRRPAVRRAATSARFRASQVSGGKPGSVRRLPAWHPASPGRGDRREPDSGEARPREHHDLGPLGARRSSGDFTRASGSGSELAGHELRRSRCHRSRTRSWFRRTDWRWPTRRAFRRTARTSSRR